MLYYALMLLVYTDIYCRTQRSIRH